MNNNFRLCLVVLIVTGTIAVANADSMPPTGSASLNANDSTTNRNPSRSAGAQRRSFVANVMAINASFDRTLQALEKRGEELHLGNVLNGSGLTSPSGIIAGHTAVSRTRQILNERRENVRLYHQQTKRLLTPELVTVLGAQMVEKLRSMLADAELFEKELETARTQYVDAIDEALSWAEQQGDTIKLQGGQISLASSEQIDQLNTLFSKARAAAAQETRLYNKAAPVYQQYLNDVQKIGKAAGAG